MDGVALLIAPITTPNHSGTKHLFSAIIDRVVPNEHRLLDQRPRDQQAREVHRGDYYPFANRWVELKGGFCAAATFQRRRQLSNNAEPRAQL